jgi:acyl-CoA reductase-like NAD-dependent aldehyde dehydrogenase
MSAQIIAETISRETGKALKDARAEVARSRETLMLSAEEAVRIEGEHVPLDATAMGAGKIAMLLRFPGRGRGRDHALQRAVQPRGPQIAPAIAAGNVIVLKPPPQAPHVIPAGRRSPDAT